MSHPPITLVLHGASVQLQEDHRFDWLTALGTVFRVFDQQDSGNISFGVEIRGTRRFIKYAGARPVHYGGSPGDAIQRLREALPLYRALEHPQLVRLTDAFETPEGYAAVFDWFPGETLHPHDTFPPPAKYTHPDSPFYRFRQLPPVLRLDALDSIFAFHVHVEAAGYTAVDFYDGSLLYDFSTNTIRICDIDLYQQFVVTNTMGRMWGSSRFMSPEEFELGAPIDGRTNVFNMGAMAFALVGGETDRSPERWEAGAALYAVAARAVQADRSARYASVAEFCGAWRYARLAGL